MTHSLNEIEALAKRAARGAGLPWGLAEESGKATRWLESLSLPGASALATVLRENDGKPTAEMSPVSRAGTWRARDGALNPLTAGALLNDCADRLLQRKKIEMADVSFPLLVTPFAAWAAMFARIPIALYWRNVTVVTDGNGIWVSDPDEHITADFAETLACAVTTTPETPPKRPQLRGNVPNDAWETLGRFAHRTYAPATEASRRRGAGAGTSDND